MDIIIALKIKMEYISNSKRVMTNRLGRMVNKDSVTKNKFTYHLMAWSLEVIWQIKSKASPLRKLIIIGNGQHPLSFLIL